MFVFIQEQRDLFLKIFLKSIHPSLPKMKYQTYTNGCLYIVSVALWQYQGVTIMVWKYFLVWLIKALKTQRATTQQLVMHKLHVWVKWPFWSKCSLCNTWMLSFISSVLETKHLPVCQRQALSVCTIDCKDGWHTSASSHCTNGCRHLVLLT